MNKIFKIFASTCALVVSMSMIGTSVCATPPNSQQTNNPDCQNSLNIVKNRIQILENRLNEYPYNINDLNSIKLKFNNTKNKFNSDEPKLFSLSSDEFYTELLEFHTDIDEINNNLDEKYILNFHIQNNKINTELFNTVNSDIDNYKNNVNNRHTKAELRQFKARISQLKSRIGYCLFHLKNVQHRLSLDMVNKLNNKANNIGEMFNSILNNIHSHNNKLDNLTNFHQEINQLHEVINSLEKDLEVISNSSDEQLQKQDIKQKFSNLNLYNANQTAHDMKELGRKAGYNNWKHQLDGIYFYADMYEINMQCIKKYEKGFKSGQRKLKYDNFCRQYRKNVRKYISSNDIIQEVPEGSCHNQ